MSIKGILEKIDQTIKEFSMLKAEDKVVVGVSGGADSMTLLHCLRNNYLSGSNIYVVHINHLLRGKTADADEEFVRKYCERNNLFLEVLRKDVKEESRILGLGIEECGRKVRYEFLRSVSKKYGAKIFTGHNLSDVSETLILNIVRGSSLKGLSSIPVVKDNVYRPMIYVSKEEILDYCKSNGIKFVSDETNLSREYNRNLIRLDIMPKLKKINPKLEDAIARLTRNVGKDEEYLEKIAKQAFKDSWSESERGVSLHKISNLEKPILKRVIKIIAGEDKYKLESKHIDLIINIIKEQHGAVMIPQGKIFYIFKDVLKYEYKCSQKTVKKDWNTPFKFGSILTERKRKFIIELVDIYEYKKRLKENNKLLKNALDYDTIDTGAIFRNRKGKDRFLFSGNNIHKTLKNIFNEKKIPIERRNDLLILESTGEIAWIEGLGASKYGKVKDNSKYVVLIKLEEEKSKCTKI